MTRTSGMGKGRTRGSHASSAQKCSSAGQLCIETPNRSNSVVFQWVPFSFLNCHVVWWDAHGCPSQIRWVMHSSETKVGEK